jgi:hypothetical protein
MCIWIYLGLIPDAKLVDFLDVALAADSTNTVKGTCELFFMLGSRRCLWLPSSLLTTHILARTFNALQEACKKGFIHRNMRKLLESNPGDLAHCVIQCL